VVPLCSKLLTLAVMEVPHPYSQSLNTILGQRATQYRTTGSLRPTVYHPQSTRAAQPETQSKLSLDA
jgi:hypothetical protein